MSTAIESLDLATKAVCGNFAQRNTSVFVGMPQQHLRIVLERRRQICEWVGVLRIARDPSNFDWAMDKTSLII